MDLQTKLAELNAALVGVFPFRLAVYNPRELKLLEKNARFMRNDTFAQLVANVKKDKGLASMPLVYDGPGTDKPVVLSGNHRVQAAVAAELEQIICMVVDRETHARRTSRDSTFATSWSVKTIFRRSRTCTRASRI